MRATMDDKVIAWREGECIAEVGYDLTSDSEVDDEGIMHILTSQ